LRSCIFFALLISLFSSFSSAQQTRFIDTRDDCLAEGGSWESYANDWRQFCALPASSQTDCDAQGGEWMLSMSSAPPQCRIDLSASGLEQQCAANGGSWGRHGSRVEYCYFEAQKEMCLAQDGVWARVGMLQKYACTLAAPDAGRPCKGKADCTYSCDYRGPYPVAEGEVEGTCRSSSSPFGCRRPVEGGRVASGICVD
jgi:hypothetical protein